MLPPLLISESLGIVYVVKSLTTRGNRYIFSFLFAFIIAFGIWQFTNAYFVRFPHEQSDEFQYSMAQAVHYAITHSNKYASIQFANQGSLYQ